MGEKVKELQEAIRLRKEKRDAIPISQPTSSSPVIEYQQISADTVKEQTSEVDAVSKR